MILYGSASFDEKAAHGNSEQSSGVSPEDLCVGDGFCPGEADSSVTAEAAAVFDVG